MRGVFIDHQQSDVTTWKMKVLCESWGQKQMSGAQMVRLAEHEAPSLQVLSPGGRRKGVIGAVRVDLNNSGRTAPDLTSNHFA